MTRPLNLRRLLPLLAAAACGAAGFALLLSPAVGQARAAPADGGDDRAGAGTRLPLLGSPDESGIVRVYDPDGTVSPVTAMLAAERGWTVVLVDSPDRAHVVCGRGRTRSVPRAEPRPEASRPAPGLFNLMDGSTISPQQAPAEDGAE